MKLNLPDGFELPNNAAIEKITPEDITEEFLKACVESSGSNCDLATMKLYLQNVCPLVKSQYNREIFLNNLIEEFYLKCEA